MLRLHKLRVLPSVLAGTRAKPLFGTRGRMGRPVVYLRLDLPADGLRSNVYCWTSNRTFRVGKAVTGIPGWGRVVVVDEPFMRHGVEHVPVQPHEKKRRNR